MRSIDLSTFTEMPEGQELLFVCRSWAVTLTPPGIHRDEGDAMTPIFPTHVARLRYFIAPTGLPKVCGFGPE